MSWIALRDRIGTDFRANGFGHPGPAPRWDPEAVMPHGTLMFEVLAGGGQKDYPILVRERKAPWPTGLRIDLTDGGRLTLRMFQGRRRIEASLDCGPLDPRTGLVVSYSWDGPLRQAIFSAQVPGTDLFVATEIAAPVPLFLRDAFELAHDKTTYHAPEVRFVAVSDAVEPIGPAASLAGDAVIETEFGALPVAEIKPGTLVMTADGGTAQVRWAGSQVLPARGSFRPLLIRAPYRGLRSDLVLAPHQRLRFAGSSVEYLFGEETVAMSAGFLRDDRSVLPIANIKTQRYYQLLLDRPAFMEVNGLAIESLDIGVLDRDRRLLRHSLLRSVPRHLMPEPAANPVPVLLDFEALTLAKISRI